MRKVLNISNNQRNAKSNPRWDTLSHPVGMTLIKQTRDEEGQWRGRELGALAPCGWDCKLAQSLQKTVWRFLKKWKTVFSHDLAIPFLGICQQKMKSLSGKDTWPSMFMAALFTIAKMWKRPVCVCVCVRVCVMEYYLDIKKENLFVPTWMNLEGTVLSKTVKWRQANAVCSRSYGN